jgi:hypothetical protein
MPPVMFMKRWSTKEKSDEVQDRNMWSAYCILIEAKYINQIGKQIVLIKQREKR